MSFNKDIEGKIKSLIDEHGPEKIPTLAERGNPYAQYLMGISIADDVKDKIYWFKRAATGDNGKNSGLVNAQFQLGFIYMYGVYGIAKDIDEAEKWLMQAANPDIETSNLAEAQHALGAFYGNDSNAKADERKAVNWYRLAAVQGYAEALYNIGLRYLFGREYNGGKGVLEKDESKAIECFIPAAQQDFVNAQYDLAVMYYKKGDTANAKKWFKKAAENGDTEAKKRLDTLFW